MIKINLVPTAIATKAGTGQINIGSLQDLVEQARTVVGGNFGDSPIRKVVLPLIALFIANSVETDQRAHEMEKASAQLQGVQAEVTKYRQEIGKTKGLEGLKKQLEADEKEIRTKLDVIKKLIDDRASPPKMMLSLSGALPSDVWLDELNIGNQQVVFKGGALGFNPISDFMKALGGSEFFTNVELKGTQQEPDARGSSVASFEVTAERR